MWIGYCSFHLGDYKKAMSMYEALSHNKNAPEDVPVNLACCYFYLGMYPEAERVSISQKPQQDPLSFSIHHYCNQIRSRNENLD
jgi:intraflagellar transport protein 56